MVGGSVVTRGSNDAALCREFWINSSSMTTSAAIASTMGTARGTTQGSWRPRAAKDPGVPSYCAVSCSCEIVAGDLNPILNRCLSCDQESQQSEGRSPEVDVFPICDTALHTATPVRRRAQPAIFLLDERVIVLASRYLSATET